MSHILFGLKYIWLGLGLLLSSIFGHGHMTNFGSATITTGNNYPTSTYSFSDNDIINAGDFNNITTYLGIRSATDSVSIQGQLYNASSTANNPPVATASGTLGIAHGGTATTTVPTNGQLLIGNGTNYGLSTLTAGSGITVTNAAGSITLGVSSALFTTSTIITASTTWVVPSGKSIIRIISIGGSGGGGGGSGGDQTNSVGGNGGSGGQPGSELEITLTGLSGGESIPIVIGAGGSGGAGGVGNQVSGSDGTAGGATTINTVLSAGGGTAGKGGTNGAAGTAGTASTNYWTAATAGSNHSGNTGGSGGNGGAPVYSIGSSVFSGGGGGAAGNGAGTNGATSTIVGFGGGGGGGGGSNGGGTGAGASGGGGKSGVVIIYY